jgi:hypothetical protein
VSWGVFETERGVHILPTDEDGYATGGHTADSSCFCGPEPNEHGVWVHEIEN